MTPIFWLAIFALLVFAYFFAVLWRYSRRLFGGSLALTQLSFLNARMSKTPLIYVIRAADSSQKFLIFYRKGKSVTILANFENIIRFSYVCTIPLNDFAALTGKMDTKLTVSEWLRKIYPSLKGSPDMLQLPYGTHLVLFLFAGLIPFPLWVPIKEILDKSSEV